MRKKGDARGGAGKRRGRNIRWVLRTLIVIAASMGSGCGLPTISYLAEPLNAGLGLGNTFHFTHDSTNNNTGDFLGYQVYYRFYDSSSASNLTTDQNDIESSTTPGIALIQSRGYRQILPDQTAGLPVTPPLIPFTTAEKAQPIVVTLDFNPDITTPIDATASTSDGVLTVKLKRNNPVYPAPNTDTLKSFLTNDYTTVDNDIPPDVTLGSGSVTIALVVVSYGFDFASFTPMYSVPVFLGNIDIPFKTLQTGP